MPHVAHACAIFPGGITRTDRLDANRKPVERTYSRDADGTAIWAESVVENSSGQRLQQAYTGGKATFRYDGFGRLTAAQQESDANQGCVTRTYEYDDRTNRTGLTSYLPGTDGVCDTTTAAAQTHHTYDTADRLTDAGYQYDAFGRTTRLPGGLQISYHTNDMVRSQQLGDSRQTWTLDPAMRLDQSLTDTEAGGAWARTSATVSHYGDDSDEPRWIVEDPAAGTYTRYVSGPDGDLAASVSSTGGVDLQLSNLHGDVAATIDLTDGTPELFDYDEFGTPAAGQADQRYGWLGAKQRSGDAMDDVVLMGARLYSPSLGRFVSVDPVAGAAATRTTTPAPIRSTAVTWTASAGAGSSASGATIRTGGWRSTVDAWSRRWAACSTAAANCGAGGGRRAWAGGPIARRVSGDGGRPSTRAGNSPATSASSAD